MDYSKKHHGRFTQAHPTRGRAALVRDVADRPRRVSEVDQELPPLSIRRELTPNKHLYVFNFTAANT